MAIAWQDRYTELNTVNGGNELENGDTATSQHINVALENGAYAKKLADQNASDITDIEQRLTDLGFKYPPTAQTLAVGGIGTLTVRAGSQSNLQGTSRQGNRVILDLNLYLFNGSGNNYVYFYRNGVELTTATAIPEIYRPLSNQKIYVPSGVATYNQSISPSNYSIRVSSPISVTLKTDGTFAFQIENSNIPYVQYPNTFVSVQSLSVNFKMGYQVAPISNQ